MSGVLKRSIAIAGHRTSITLEDEFWAGLREIAEADGKTLRALVAEIDAARGPNNLSSAIRLRVLHHYRAGCGLPPRNTSNGEN
ncbi:ribbon-helix-helix domain-containing protein [Terrihabitans sp. B22-R8]|uniref:ribbon-helix-helix domain-containing protein n=1 Tax=Terrihabitans sp. B22-R8 TaxID=3425128 RepID=UPI00403CC967